MEVEITTIPPVPTETRYKLALELSQEEMDQFYCLMANSSTDIKWAATVYNKIYMTFNVMASLSGWKMTASKQAFRTDFQDIHVWNFCKVT